MKKKQGNQKRGCGGKKNSVQELLSIQYFTKYGLMTEHGEMVFFQIAPTNISVLSYENIERKINHLQGLISMHPDMEIVCTDSCECFDGNREYLRRRALEESNPQVRSILEQDREMLSQMQSEMSNARQFYLVMPATIWDGCTCLGWAVTRMRKKHRLGSGMRWKPSRKQNRRLRRKAICDTG